jgi:energy-coupling factor transport system ATP-binding protein
MRLKGSPSERLAVDSVSLDIGKGRMTALVGRTGSGKSSLLELLDALSFPSSGKALSFGEDTLAPGTDIKALRMRSPLAIQRPEAALFEPYAGDDVAFGPRNRGLSGSALVAAVKGAMGAVDLPYEAWRDRGTRSLSGGEKRRLALAGVLAMEGEAILLDEPTSALDPETRARVRALMAGLGKEGGTLVLATHSMEEAAMCDTIVVLGGGKVLAQASPAFLFHEGFDPAWGLERPYACGVAVALGAYGLALPERPLDIPGLAAALHARIGPGAQA